MYLYMICLLIFKLLLAAAEYLLAVLCAWRRYDGRGMCSLCKGGLGDGLGSWGFRV